MLLLLVLLNIHLDEKEKTKKNKRQHCSLRSASLHPNAIVAKKSTNKILKNSSGSFELLPLPQSQKCKKLWFSPTDGESLLSFRPLMYTLLYTVQCTGKAVYKSLSHITGRVSLGLESVQAQQNESRRSFCLSSHLFSARLQLSMLLYMDDPVQVQKSDVYDQNLKKGTKTLQMNLVQTSDPLTGLQDFNLILIVRKPFNLCL